MGLLRSYVLSPLLLVPYQLPKCIAGHNPSQVIWYIVPHFFNLSNLSLGCAKDCPMVFHGRWHMLDPGSWKIFLKFLRELFTIRDCKGLPLVSGF